MAQKQGQYDSAVDSIFNFIFSSNRKNAPQKPRPNLKGVSGNELADGLAEVAMSPAIRANEEVLNFVNEPFNNIELSERQISLDKDKAPVKVAVSANDFSSFISNPEKYIDDSFKKTEGLNKAGRKLNMIRGFGGIVDLGIGSVMARASGAGPIDSLEMGSVVGNGFMSQEWRDGKAENLAARTSAFAMAEKKKLNYNEANKLAQSFASVMESSKIDSEILASDTMADKQRLKRIVGKKLSTFGTWSPDQIDELFDEYVNRAKDYADKGVGIKGLEWNLGKMDRGVPKDDHKKINYGAGVDEWKKSKSPQDKLIALKYEELDAQSKLLRAVDPSSREILELEKQKRNLRIWQSSNGSNMKFSRFLGEAHLNIQVIDQYVLKGGLLPAMVSGDFYDIRKNNLAPCAEGKVEFKTRNGGADQTISGKILLPRGDMKSKLYTGLTNYYYLTAGSLAKTFLVNGEGFLYLNHRKQEKLRGLIMGSDSLYDYVSNNQSKFSALLGGISVAGNQKEVLEKLAGDYLGFLNILENNAGSITDPELLRVIGKMGKIQDRLEKSLGGRWSKFITKLSSKLSIKNNMQKWLGYSIVAIFGKKLGEQAKQFLVSGQISLRRVARILAKKAVHLLAQALGFATTGGLANGLILVATEVIYFVGEKMLKPVVKIFALVAWSLGMLLILLVLGAFSMFDSINPFSRVGRELDVKRNTTLLSYEFCGAGQGPGANGDGTDDYFRREGDFPSNPPPSISGIICPLNPVPVRCTQGPFGKFSHSNNNAIDVAPIEGQTYWYAPTDGFVSKAQRVFYKGSQKCGGIVHFKSEELGVTFVLIHATPRVTQGQEVRKGELVGEISLESHGNINFRSGSGTCATGKHFHLEVRHVDTLLDRYYRESLCCDITACPGSSSPVGVPAGCGGETSVDDCEDYKTFSAVEFKNLGDSVLGTSGSKSSITGNAQADSKIQGLAENRGYKLRVDGGSLKGSTSSAYTSMAAKAKEDNITLHLGSGYRSIADQRSLFLNDLPSACKENNYATIINGGCDSEINDILKTRSIPGYSKHHTGFAIDLKCTSSGTYLDFKNTECYRWVSENNYCNAKRFGFIPSYPSGAGNQGPDPEEWEYIWVGEQHLKK